MNTFVGNIKQSYVVGIDEDTALNLRVGTALEVRYNAGNNTPFKHYSSNIESDPKPFGKLSFSISYRKIGGASQINFVRFFSSTWKPLHLLCLPRSGKVKSFHRSIRRLTHSQRAGTVWTDSRFQAGVEDAIGSKESLQPTL